MEKQQCCDNLSLYILEERITLITMPLPISEVSSFPLHFFQLQVILFQKTPTVKPENMKYAAANTSQEEIKLNRLEPLLHNIRGT